jgi:transposase
METITRRDRRYFSDEFKTQMVALLDSGKKRIDIIREYDLTGTTFDKWVKQAHHSGSFRTQDNLSDQEKELKELRKENKRLLMENDILKQAALIMARKER